MDDLDYFKKASLFVFDVDDTLAPSKLPLKQDMIDVILRLLAKRKVAIIGGGAFVLYERQFANLIETHNDNLKNIFLFPTCGARFMKYKDGWQEVYRHDLSDGDKKKIINAIDSALESSEIEFPKNTFGPQIEDRETQISFSALGQEAPIELKRVWDPDQTKRIKLKSILDRMIPEFEVRIGGTTTIDVTKKGIDKAYGIKMMEESLGIPVDKMVFFGDALFPGGNDFPVIKTGIKTITVKNYEETRDILREIIPLLD